MKKKKKEKKQKKAPVVELSNDNPCLPFWYLLIPSSVLSILGFLFYYPSLHYSFQFDDLANITKYFHIRHKTLSDLFFANSRWISYWLNTTHYRIGKFNPFSYRLFNVCMHTLTSVLILLFVYYALSGLKKKNFFTDYALSIAFVTAGLFLLHPVQTQTISYVIQGQLEGSAGLFIVAMSLCFLMLGRARNMLLKWGLTIFLFLLAVFSCGTKEIAIVSPALLVLVDWFFVAQGDWHDLKKRWWLHAGIFMLVLSIYIYFLKPAFFTRLIGLKMQARNNIGNVLTEKQTDKILPLPYFISQFKVVLHYIFMFLWPFNICIEYDWKLSRGFLAPDCILPFLVLAMLGVLLFRHIRKNPTSVIGFAALWFLVGVAPRSSIVPSSELLTDYKTYVPSVAIMLLLAAGIVKLVTFLLSIKKLPGLKPHYVQAAVLIMVLLPIGYTAYRRNLIWSSGEAFWMNVLQNAPGKARAYNNYAVAISEKGRYKEAIPYYKKAIAMDQKYPDPHNNLAVAYSLEGNIDQAIQALKEGIKIQPYYPEAYNNLASFLITQKKYDEAEKSLRLALRLRPHYGKAFFNLGKIALSRGNSEQAFEYFKNACTKADLDTEQGFKIYASMAMQMKKYDDAAFAFSKIMEFNPTIETTLNLANAYHLKGDLVKAEKIYQAILQKNPTDARIVYNLGETYFKQKKIKAALNSFRKARKLNYDLPNLPMRIALCLEHLGNREEAKKELQLVLSNKKSPDQYKIAARAALAQMSGQKNFRLDAGGAATTQVA